MTKSPFCKSILIIGSSVFAVGFALAQVEREQPTPAPAGFNNVTNGFSEQDQFDKDRKTFEDVETILPEKKTSAETKTPKSRHGSSGRASNATDSTDDEQAGGGLGPVYNATSCVGCHQNPVTGSSSQVSEIRAGRLKNPNDDPNNPKSDFVEPPGGSLIHQRAIDAQIQEHVQAEDKVRTLRMSTNTLGNGFVEVIPDEVLIGNCKRQIDGIRGLPIAVPVAVRRVMTRDNTETEFVLRVGRFGWKDQEASLLNFSANAYLNEMGITSPLQPTENKSNGRDVTQFDPVADPEDKATAKNPFGEDVEAFTRFMRSTRVPPRDFALAQGPTCKDPLKPGEAQTLAGGEKLFHEFGCTTCHRPQYLTPPKDDLIRPLWPEGAQGTDLKDGKVPEALANKIFCPFSDFLLHDIGTKDGIVQTQHAQLPSPGARRFMQQAPTEYQAPRRSQPALPQIQQQLARRTPPISEAECQPQIQEVFPASASVESREANQQRVLDQRTRHRVRTAPLWGLRVRPQLLHDGSALTIRDAILAHREEASDSRTAFEQASEEQKTQLLMFLNSL
jgi:CxxC motif-containing protein (DUF1111 family)